MNLPRPQIITRHSSQANPHLDHGPISTNTLPNGPKPTTALQETSDVKQRPQSPHQWARAILLMLATIGLMTSNFAAADSSGFQVHTYAITNVQIVTAPGREPETGHIVVRFGRIAAVGNQAEIPADADVIRGDGLTVYPGFVDAGTTAFLDDTKPVPIEGRKAEVSKYALAGMRVDHHSGLTPEFAAAEHLKLATAELDKFRQAGFVAVHVLPSGRIASGQGAVVNLSSLPPRESLLSTNSFATLELFARGGDTYPSTKMGAHSHLRQTFLDAERHTRQGRLFSENVTGMERPAADPVFDTFTAIKSGRLRTLFLANARDDLERALNFAAEHQLRITIWGGLEAERVADRLKKTETDVILHVDFGNEPKLDPPKPSDSEFPELPELQRVREHKLSEWKRRITGLADLHKAGVRFAISSRDGKAPEDLLKSIRQAITFGLDRNAALAALTTHPAAILGLEKDLGTITVGQPANLIAMTGPFDHEQSKVRHVIVNGQRFEYHKDAKPVPLTKPGDSRTLNLAGAWAVDIQTTEGALRASLELTQTDRTLGGRFQSEQGDGRVSSGTATSDSFDFTVSIGAGDATIQLKFDSVGWNWQSPKDKTPPASDRPVDTNAAQPTEIHGHLKSPFGSTTKWSAKKVIPAQPPQTTAVQLSGIDTADTDEPQKAAPTGVSALTPANVESNSKPAPAARRDQPLEFPADRRARPLITGGSVLIQHGTVLTATGATLPKTSILVRSGSIVAIGPDLQPDSGMTVIDAAGRYVMPGIIDTHSHIMISNGINEYTDSIVCDVRIRDVVSTDDPSEYRALAGGVTTARLLHGSANCIGGQDAVVQLKHGLTAAEHLFPGAHSGVKFALGENVKSRGGRFPNTRLGVEATLNRAFLEALDYRRVWLAYEQRKQQAGGAADRLLPPRRDLRLEALVEILNHQKFIHSHCYRADEILMLLRVAENHGIRVWSLQHVLEGYKVAPEIVKHGASCSTFADWWAYKMEAFDAIPQNAALLHEAGANAVIKSDDWELIRHLYQEASKTVRYGNMPPDVALQAITLNPARELGLSDRIGSIEVGKQADLAIFSGHPLNAFSRCEQTLIAGEVYFTRDKQPTIMTPTTASRSATPSELKLIPPQERLTRIELDPAKATRYAIVGATLHPIDAADIPEGMLIVQDGKITALGQSVPLPDGIPVIRARGLHLYPGLIDAGTSVGLIEIGMIRATNDLSDSGQFQADLRAGIAVNPDSELIPVARAGGITTILCLPAGSGNMTSHYPTYGPTISGQASLIRLAGWTMPEMVFNMEAGLHVIWPSGKNRKSDIEDLARYLKEARVYDKARQLESESKPNSQSEPPSSPLILDPRYEAFRPYLRGDKPVFVEAETEQQIFDALQFANKEKLKIVLCGATDGWKVADSIRAANVPVIVGPVMRKPIEEFDPFDAPYANAGRLHEAGIALSFRSDTASNSRNVPFEAAMAVAYGLPESTALRAITLSSAEILGIADQVGSLTVGKRANLILTDGSPLQPTTQIKGIVIDGQAFQPESRQTKFYDKYRTRLHDQPK
ncbi:amidohydrolase family protein [Schlesneria paludicola]|uniref:amidohydrolase family protein n=1 Tax=Schlesneria paludicola TaxID=360056 RepID=UPI00029A2DEA|nr:amidohydrolase family protein [Schlesneria paludicola]